MPKISIAPIHVPINLVGVVQPVQALCDNGSLVRGVVPLVEGQVTVIDVPYEGRYTVRAEMPTGETYAAYAVTGSGDQAPSPLDLFGDEEYVARSPRPDRQFTAVLQTKRIPDRVKNLQFNVSLPQAIQAEAAFDGMGFDGASDDGDDGGAAVAPGIDLVDNVDDLAIDAPSAEQPTMKLDSYRWQGWDGEGTIRLQITSFFHDQKSFPATLELEYGFGHVTSYDPLYVHTRAWPESPEGAKFLIIWPPYVRESTLEVLPDDDDQEKSFIVSAHGTSTDTEVLFNAMLSGALDDARSTMRPIIQEAEGALQSKMSDPLRATLASYVLWKVAPNLREDWVRNLATWYPNIPDASILYGWHLIAAGTEEEAIPFFLGAQSKGIPIFTEGIRLQLRGLNYLAELNPDNEDLQLAKMRAHRLAAAANMDSEVTCLKLGKHLNVQV